MKRIKPKKAKGYQGEFKEHKEPQALIGGESLRQAVFGFEDGLVNVLGIVTGVAAASSSSSFVIIAGLAGAVANSISMAAGTYLSIKSQIQHYEMEERRERHEIETVPEIEREEIREIYRKKGFSGKELEKVTRKITSNRKVWLDTMMREELGLSREFPNPLHAAFIMSIAVVIGSAFPILPFLIFEPMTALIVSISLSTIVLFAAGALKGIMTSHNWVKSGAEMLLVASIAAAASWTIGTLIGIAL